MRVVLRVARTNFDVWLAGGFEISLDRAAVRTKAVAEDGTVQAGLTVEAHESFWTVEKGRSAASLILLVWVLGTGGLLVRLISGTRKVNRLLLTAQSVQHAALEKAMDQLHQSERLPRVPIRFVKRLHSPVVVGTFRPTVILPEKLLDQLDADQLRCVLAHELTHVRQRDPLVGFIQRIVEASYWPHPFVHLLNRDLVRAREEVCDNVALHGTTAPHYANTLLKVALGISTKAPASGMIGLMTPPWKLEERVKGLLDPQRRVITTMNTRHLALMAVALATGTALIAGTRVVAAPVPMLPQETVKIVGHFDRTSHSIKYKAKTYKPATKGKANAVVKVITVSRPVEEDSKTYEKRVLSKVTNVRVVKDLSGDSKMNVPVEDLTIVSDDDNVAKFVTKTVKAGGPADVYSQTEVQSISSARKDPLKGKQLAGVIPDDPTRASEKDTFATTVTQRDGKVEQIVTTSDPLAVNSKDKTQTFSYTITRDGDKEIVVTPPSEQTGANPFVLSGRGTTKADSQSSTIFRTAKPGRKAQVRYDSAIRDVFVAHPPVQTDVEMIPVPTRKPVYRVLPPGHRIKVQFSSDQTKFFVARPNKASDRSQIRVVTTDSPTTVYIKGEEIRIVGDSIRVVYVKDTSKQKPSAKNQTKSAVKKKG